MNHNYYYLKFDYEQVNCRAASWKRAPTRQFTPSVINCSLTSRTADLQRRMKSCKLTGMMSGIRRSRRS